MKIWAIIKTLIILAGAFYVIRLFLKVFSKSNTTIKNKANKSKTNGRFSDSIGQYTDYEEIKD